MAELVERVLVSRRLRWGAGRGVRLTVNAVVAMGNAQGECRVVIELADWTQPFLGPLRRQPADERLGLPQKMGEVFG